MNTDKSQANLCSFVKSVYKFYKVSSRTTNPKLTGTLGIDTLPLCQASQVFYKGK